MAILFYEGLPGSGKSYEAMATQIIPMLQKGREVVAYIEGLNHERIAEVAELPVERVHELLHVLTRDDMRPREAKKDGKTVPIDGTWLDKTRDNAFHVFDESQNWWPNRLRATEALTQFVTEHRHRGIDILLMGQSLKDVLALWRRRVDQKFTFLKLTALGSSKRYRITISKGQGDDQFVKVSDRISKYDSKYFGTYASHVSDSTNTDTYTDKRVNFMSSGFIKYAVPIAIFLAVWGGSKSWSFFHPAPPPPKKTAASPAPTLAKPASGPVAARTNPGQGDAKPDTRSPQERHLSDLSKSARIRLAGLMEAAGHLTGVVEWVEGDMRVVERVTLDQLRDWGVDVEHTRGSVRLKLGQWVELATMWPIGESESRVSEYRQSTIRPASDGGLPPSDAGRVVAAASLPGYGLTIIDSEREPSSPAQRTTSRIPGRDL